MLKSVKTSRFQAYKLQGKSLDALLTSLELSGKASAASSNNPVPVAEALGLIKKYIVDMQRGSVTYGQIVFPEIYRRPESGANDKAEEYYMICPVGNLLDIKGRKISDKITHFEPEDAEKLTEEETNELFAVLFPPMGGKQPVLQSDPLSVDKHVLEAYHAKTPSPGPKPL